MWTDTYRNFGVLHDGLLAASLPGYLGYMTLRGEYEGAAVAQLFVDQLHLPQSIALRDGGDHHGHQQVRDGVGATD